MNEFAPLYMAGTGSQSGLLSSGQLRNMAMLSYTAYGHGYMIGQVFFALWVLPLGILIYRSKFIPRVFGILFMIEVFGGLLSVAVHFLIPNGSIETILLFPGTLAEFGFMFWLLIWGINVSKLPVLTGYGKMETE
ncbi:MAG: DUF4386 domain-containing protein [Eubacteriales bacterium]